MFHEFDKSDKGHHDKAKHEREYDEEKGEEKKDHEEAGHYGEEHHGEEGEKDAKFDEEGKHQKGYSTKGEHSVFKKVSCYTNSLIENLFWFWVIWYTLENKWFGLNDINKIIKV